VTRSSKLTKHLPLNIADIAINFIRNGYFPSFEAGEDHCRFLSKTASSFNTVIQAYYVTDYRPVENSGNCLFDSQALWKLSENSDHYLMEIRIAGDEIPFRVLEIAKDFRKGRLFCPAGNRPLGSITGYPLDELLIVNILSHHKLGIEVHACAVDDNNRGFLFVGSSGAGKSTIARLWMSHPSAKVLSDDRIIIRKVGNEFFAYGTPWHGDAGVSMPDDVKVEKVFFIGHSQSNYVKPLNLIDAAARSFVCSFPPFWNSEGIKFILSFIDIMVKGLPCYELGFAPDKNIIDFIRKLE
jgi:hypothetical protein